MMLIRLRLLAVMIGGFVFYSCLTGHAQSSVNFTNLTPAEGLSNGAVVCMTQDKSGFIWVGTKNGLNKFDGSRFKVYNNKNSNLIGNGISEILITHDNIFFVATYSGLNIYDDSLDIFKIVPYDTVIHPESHKINEIFEDMNGAIWLGTERGLFEVVREGNGFFVKHRKD